MSLINAIYTRQSVDRIDSISVESQVEYCKKEAAGGSVKVYTDKGYSGKNVDRPAFQELMLDIQSGKVRRVIVYRLDRISRSVLDFANVVDMFQKYGVDFVSTMEKFDTGTPIGKAMLMIVMIFAQLERETIQQRVVDAYRSRSKRGFYMGGKIPYGFRLTEITMDGVRTKMYESMPKEAEIVQRIFAMYAEPQTSLGDVARYLASCEIKNQKGDPFTRGRIRDMVINPCYVRADYRLYEFFQAQGTELVNRPEDFIGANGAYLYSGTGGRRKTISLQGQILVLAPHEGLIQSDIWIKCRSKCLKNAGAARPVKAKATWLAGKIKCAECGYALSVKIYHCKTKADNRYYLCSHKYSGVGCNFSSLDADLVDEIVFEEMRKKLEEFGTLTKRKRECAGLQAIKMKVRVEEIDQDIRSLLNKIPFANETVMEYINDRVAELDGKKKELCAEAEQLMEWDDYSFDGLTGYLNRWEKVSVKDRVTIVDQLVESVIASREKIRINWKI